MRQTEGVWTTAAALFLLTSVLAGAAAAQQPSTPSAASQDALSVQAASDASADSPADAAQTMFPHPDGTWWWVSGQANSIVQGHGNFHSPYEGSNSFQATGSVKASAVETLYLGTRLHPGERNNTEFLFDVESAGGRGLSQALGLAGFTNLDVVRNPTLGITPYIARAELHQTFALAAAMVDNPAGRGWQTLAGKVAARRLELRVGKLSTVDFFDLNKEASDSHLQFTNWTIDNTGAYDYAADTRGYTYGALAEYQDRTWAIRYGLMTMPTVANGIDLDWALRRARGEQVEAEARRSLLAGRKGVVRTLAYWNHANMGVYRDALHKYLDGATPSPEITAHPQHTTVKYGFASNFEQELTESISIFGRFGWNEGQHESYAYTEVDQTFVFGADFDGKGWGRNNDKVGVALVTNAIKRDHQKYLALGGLGFLLGDGRLNYAREDTLEAYYNVHIYRGLYGALQSSFVTHPGYNQDRGPVFIPGGRLHVEF